MGTIMAQIISVWRLLVRVSTKIGPAVLARRDGSRYGAAGPPVPEDMECHYSGPESEESQKCWSVFRTPELPALPTMSVLPPLDIDRAKVPPGGKPPSLFLLFPRALLLDVPGGGQFSRRLQQS